MAKDWTDVILEGWDIPLRKCKECGRINTHRLDSEGNFTCDGEWEDLSEEDRRGGQEESESGV